MKICRTRFAIPAFVALTVAVAGITLAQSGTSPSGTPAPTKQAAAAQAPKVIALIFYADWCPGCKALKPKLEEVMTDVESQPCLFVKLDQTEKGSRQAEYMLASLGLGELWKEHGGKTGFVLLVNSKSRKVVSTVMYDQETAAIRAAFSSALKG